MIFNSYLFLGLFLPAVLVIFYFPGLQALRVYALLAGSLIFYAVSGLEHLAVLVIDILWVYGLTRMRTYTSRPLLLVAAIVLPVALLLHYKYLSFLLNDVLQLDIRGGPESGTFDLFNDLVLPAGISFFTFQVVSYAIDRYRDAVRPAPDLKTFALYISFFPQLVAGPIVRFAQVREQLGQLTRFVPSRDDINIAIRYTVIGLAVKVLIADTLGSLIEPLVTQPGGGSPILASYLILAYSFQIYFDFFGYSMIALGLARAFGLRLPINFDRPYNALNPREFWRRWHITLSFWIRDYLYLPLGGNRAYVRNILIIFAIAGLWHGAGWSFIVWGLFHGALVLAYHFTRNGWDRLPALVQQALTFILVSCAWVLFVFDFTALGEFLSSLRGAGSAALPNPDLNMWLAVGIAAVVAFGLDLNRLAQQSAPRPAIRSGMALAMATLAMTAILFIDRSDTFIYFRF